MATLNEPVISEEKVEDILEGTEPGARLVKNKLYIIV